VKRIALFLSMASLVACGGGATKKPPPTPVVNAPPEDVEEPEPPPEEEPEPPPPPLEWTARAELAPVKGVKLKAATVMFHQVDGEGTTVSSDAPLSGLAAGTYHLVVHEGADCGKNAARIGGMFEPAAGVALTVAVTKKEPGAVEGEVDFTLDGEDSIAGHTLVLHADKKGAPGKVAACGAIVLDSPE
jgi:hypothetical protein